MLNRVIYNLPRKTDLDLRTSYIWLLSSG